MNGNLLFVINITGLMAFGSIGLGVYYLVATWYWNTGKYGIYDLPLWVELGIMPFFILVWGGIMITLMLTVWKPDLATYTISISW